MNFIRNLKTKYVRWRAIRGLISNYEKRLEVEKLMEDWITKRIIDGQTNRREELTKKRLEIDELKLFLDYLKKV